MATLTWLRGLVLHRPRRLVSNVVGVAIAVALIASIGTFLSSTTSQMTSRAVMSVPVDWQVEVQAGGDPGTVLERIRSTAGVARALPVTFAATPGLEAKTAGTVQTTGAGQVVGLPTGYGTAFRGELRTLAGRGDGVLLAQQTAANLHARPGDRVAIERTGRRPVTVTVDGIVELPAADSLFQRVGAPAGAQPSAPPDNVILLPAATFAAVERAGVVTQIHVGLDRRLPSSPRAAYDAVTGRAHNLESRLAGAALVGDNVGTALDQARADALYAQLLFLFLGLPGAILAGLLTVAVGASGAVRRRRDAALLRTRGASTRRLVGLALAETGVAAGAGIAVGLVAALLIGQASFGAPSFGAGPVAATLWAVGAALAGAAVACLAIVRPAWQDARAITVVGQRTELTREAKPPVWKRGWLDVIAVVAAGLVLWQASRGGYSLVLAPEGVAQVSVNWYALLAPVLAWIGGGLLILRLADALLLRGRQLLSRTLRPLAGELAPTVAAGMTRRRRLLSRSVALVALATAFAASTAVFNSTYAQQAEADARLTNGADVTVTESPGATIGPDFARRLAGVRGVKSVEPLQHRFAYIGADLQDLYGVRPQTIVAAGRLQDGWFAGGTAARLIATLGARRDAILVSAETVKDFQLRPGDPLRLRLQDGRTKQFTTVVFRYVGVAKEFPTAPKDSFFVANADYVAHATGSTAVGSFLLQTSGSDPTSVAAHVRALVGPQAQVTDIGTQRRVVGSNLTAVELSGLTRIELTFALALAVGATGLSLFLGLAERRRTFAILGALGARGRSLGGFVWGEALYVTVGGIVLGAVLAAGIAWMLIKVLTGVFDPPPDRVAVPYGYLVALALLACGSVAVAGTVVLRSTRRLAVERLRDL